MQVKNLAGHVLTRALRLVAGRAATCGISPLLAETLVGHTRFTGQCYRAANWIDADLMTGRGREDRHHERRGATPGPSWSTRQCPTPGTGLSECRNPLDAAYFRPRCSILRIAVEPYPFHQLFYGNRITIRGVNEKCLKVCVTALAAFLEEGIRAWRGLARAG